MRDTRLRRLLAIEYPILQAGVPWVSNPELVAAVSEAGGLGILHPSAGMASDGDMLVNLRENIRATRRLTTAPFGVCFYLANPMTEALIDVALQESARIAITYGGSPTLFTGKLKGEDVTVLHQVSTVRHARGAEAQGVDVVVADGYEGGGIRGPEEIPNLVLVPQIAEAVSIPIIVSGGVMDARGYVAASALGAHGVQLGTRFVATHECIAHPRYKEALLGAIDTGTVVAGRYHWPTRLLRSGKSINSKDIEPPEDSDRQEFWDAELGATQIREAILDGNLDSSVAYCGAGVGLVSEIMGAAEVVQSLVAGSRTIISSLR